MRSLTQFIKQSDQKCCLHPDATTPPRMRMRGQRYKVHVYLTADALSPSQYVRKAGTCSILRLPHPSPQNCGRKIPRRRGGEDEAHLAPSLNQVHSRTLAIVLKVRPGPVGRKSHSLNGSSISQLPPPPCVFLAWDPDSRTVPFTPSLGFHRLGLSAELSPPVVRDSVRMSRPGLVREHSWDCLPLTFL